MQKTIKDLLIEELKDVLSAENQIVKALPKVVSAVESPELKEAYQTHLKETKEQINRLKKVFKILKEEPKEKFCKATKGLIDECQEVMTEFSKSLIKDVAIISKTQRIEHYEISAYGTLCTLAKELGFREAAKLLHENLDEEVHADKLLSKIAEGGFLKSGINHKAHLAEEEEPIKNKKDSISQKLKKAVTPSKSAVKSIPKKAKAVAKKVVSKAETTKKGVVNLIKKGVSKTKSSVSSKNTKKH